MSMHHHCTALYCGFAARKLAKEGWGGLYRDRADLPITVYCSRAEGKDVRIFCTGRVYRLIKGLQISRKNIGQIRNHQALLMGPKQSTVSHFHCSLSFGTPKPVRKVGEYTTPKNVRPTITKAFEGRRETYHKVRKYRRQRILKNLLPVSPP